MSLPIFVRTAKKLVFLGIVRTIPKSKKIFKNLGDFQRFYLLLCVRFLLRQAQ